jgi:hypothetical protein
MNIHQLAATIIRLPIEEEPYDRYTLAIAADNHGHESANVFQMRKFPPPKTDAPLKTFR